MGLNSKRILLRDFSEKIKLLGGNESGILNRSEGDMSPHPQWNLSP